MESSEHHRISGNEEKKIRDWGLEEQRLKAREGIHGGLFCNEWEGRAPRTDMKNRHRRTPTYGGAIEEAALEEWRGHSGLHSTVELIRIGDCRKLI